MIVDFFLRVNALYTRVRWKSMIKKMKKVGENCHVGNDFRVVGPHNISIGNNFCAGRFIMLQTWEEYFREKTGMVPELIIGNNVSIMDDCQISCMNKIVIEDGVLIGSNTFITDNFHGNNSLDEMYIPPLKRKLYSKGEVHIGNNVWIGRNVCIMPGVTIGEGAIIGANSVVTKNVPSGGIVAGVPAALIRNIADE